MVNNTSNLPEQCRIMYCGLMRPTLNRTYVWPQNSTSLKKHHLYSEEWRWHDHALIGVEEIMNNSKYQSTVMQNLQVSSKKKKSFSMTTTHTNQDNQNKIQGLEWPNHSPHLNPIQHLWWLEMGCEQEICQLYRVRTLLQGRIAKFCKAKIWQTDWLLTDLTDWHTKVWCDKI